MILFGKIEIRLVRSWKYQVEQLILQGKAVDAIRLYRSKTGKGVRESYDYYQSVKQKLGMN